MFVFKSELINKFMSYRKFLNNFYIYRFFKDFAFIYAVYVILFRLRGLSIFEISILLAVWAAFVVIFEIPTGALADRWNRKYMLVLGMLSKAVGFLIWIFANSFSLFLLGFLFWSIQSTFCSGTQEALLYDTLKSYRKQKEYKKIIGNGNFYGSIAIGSSMIIGGFLASISFNIVLILSSLAMIVSMLAASAFKEIRFKRTSTQETKYIQLIRSAIKRSMRNRFLLRLMLYSLIVFALVGTLDEYDQLFIGLVGVPLAFFGIWGAIRFGSEALGGKIAYKIEEYFKSKYVIYILSLLSGICLLISISFPSIFVLPIYVLIYFLISISDVFVEGELQKQIKTHERATIISINHFMENISSIAFLSGFGILSAIGGLYSGFLFFALLFIVYSIISIIGLKK